MIWLWLKLNNTIFISLICIPKWKIWSDNSTVCMSAWRRTKHPSRVYNVLKVGPSFHIVLNLRSYSYIWPDMLWKMLTLYFYFLNCGLQRKRTNICFFFLGSLLWLLTELLCTIPSVFMNVHLCLNANFI